MKSVLIIEDDKHIVDLLEIHLKDLNCLLIKAYNGESGLEQINNSNFDLIILDIMLPNISGIDICKEIRKRNILTPILMLTAKSEEKDIVSGLDAGADDYLTKPFGIREFIARTKAILRRGDIATSNETTINKRIFKDLEIDEEKRKVIVKNCKIDLTRKEFDLLFLLASHPGKSYSREQILNLLWGYEFEGFEHTVNSHINRLRSKIEINVSQPNYILTTWGVGYRFSEEAVY